MTLAEAAGWVAPAATMTGAIMTAANLGARVTGWGFVVFTLGAAAWMTVAAATGQSNLFWSNGFLLVVDVIGIWRWLGRRARYDQAAGAASQASRAAKAVPTLFALSALEGRPVHDASGQWIATTVEAMAACDTGAVAYVVVRTGGVAGVGEQLFALGWNEVQVAADAVHTRLSAAALGRRRPLDALCWPESARAAGVA